MPTWQAIVAFTLAASVLIAVPGPNHLYIVTRSLSQGRLAGVASSFGVETGTLVHLVLAAAGLSYVISTSLVAFSILTFAGAAYLIYLGVRTLRSTTLQPDLPPDTPDDNRSGAFLVPYGQGVLVNVLNPKVVIFFVAFLPTFLDPTRPFIGQIAVLGLIMVALGLTSNLIYALGATALAARLRHLNGSGVATWGRRAAGWVYLGLGLTTALVAIPAGTPAPLK
ncbi:MAG: LysE family translocator [Propioniciclava sp.]